MKKLKWIHLSNNLKVVISKKVMEQITYLCNRINSVEWSGILLYSMKGDIKNKNAVAVLEYIYPMDKGTGGYTEYEVDEDFIDWRMNHPESLTWIQGHIHSHNNMAAYFSGTDDEELEENAEGHNFYLSIVVNNKMEIVGKVVMLGETEEKERTFSLKGLGGKLWKLKLTPKQENAIFYRDCDIEVPKAKIDADFIDRVNEIIHKSDKKYQSKPYMGYDYGKGTGSIVHPKSDHPLLTDDFFKRITEKSEQLSNQPNLFTKVYPKHPIMDVFDIESIVERYNPFAFIPAVRDLHEKWITYFFTTGESSENIDLTDHFTSIENNTGEMLESYVETHVKSFSKLLSEFTKSFNYDLSVETALIVLLYDLQFYEDMKIHPTDDGIIDFYEAELGTLLNTVLTEKEVNYDTK